MKDAEWVEVKGKQSRQGGRPAVSKSTQKNERRKVRRQQEQRARDAEAAKSLTHEAEQHFYPGIEQALSASLAELDEGAEKKDEEHARESRERRLRNLRKQVRAIDVLAQSPIEKLNPAQRAKMERKPVLVADINELMAWAAIEAEAHKAAEDAAAIALAERTDQMQKVLQKVSFDMEFACPICTDVLEAATVALPCRHVFCRACLEMAMARAATASSGDPLACICPLCRSCLFDPSSGKIATEPARQVRRRMGSKKGKCQCGASVPMTSFRQHLRTCDATSSVYGEKRKIFGHEFAQPSLDPERCRLLSSGRKGELPLRARVSIPEGYDEDCEVQAALLESLTS